MIKPIRTERDHREALERIEALIDAEVVPGSGEADELNALTTLVQDYESRYFPSDKPDPVDAIHFRMEQQGLTPRDLVPYIGSPSKVSEVLARKRPLSLAMIRALHFGLGIPASSLLNDPDSREESQTFDWTRFPIKTMLARKWIKVSEGVSAVDAVRRFVSQVGLTSGLATAYRTSAHVRSARSMDREALFAWTVRVITEALRSEGIAQYQPGTVTLDFMRAVARLSVLDKGPRTAQEYLAKQGIALCIERHLPRTYLDGAAILFRLDRPIIGLTVRYDRIDNFWFTLMHELAHVALHFEGGTSVFYDDLELQGLDNSAETEADDLAAEALVPTSEWEKSPASKIPSPDAAFHLAKRVGVHPAIIAGKIRHQKKKYRILPNLVGSGQIRECFPEIDWDGLK